MEGAEMPENVENVEVAVEAVEAAGTGAPGAQAAPAATVVAVDAAVADPVPGAAPAPEAPLPEGVSEHELALPEGEGEHELALPEAEDEGEGDAGGPGDGQGGSAGPEGDPAEAATASVARRSARRRGSRGRGRGDGEGRPATAAATATGTGEAQRERSPGGQQGQSQEAGEDAEEKVRSQMLVQCREDRIQVAVLEGRTLVEHYVAHTHSQSIAGNIYLGRVQNVLPGMEAAFVDIGTPKNAVLYAGDVGYTPDEFEGKKPRIEHILAPGSSILVQVVKDPMGSKGARLTTEISLPGRFVVLVPEDDSMGISRRLPDAERERLRRILEQARPQGYGIIVRTAAEGASEEELRHDLQRLEALWHDVYRTATRANAPALVYEEPELVIRVVREHFSAEYRRLVVDDQDVYDRIVGYLGEYDPDLLKRVQHYDGEMSLYRRYHVAEQLRRALDRKVWLPSGGCLVFDKSEALTVIDVNTAKNVGKSSLEETVFQNNLEAADEIARQLRLRDIGGIIVIDFIDMEIRKNRDAVLKAFRDAVGKDKTKTQVYDISALGLVEMTRKNVSEGLIENFSRTCPECSGRGLLIEEDF